MPYNYIERHDIVQNGFKQQLSDLFQVKAVGNLNSTQLNLLIYAAVKLD